MTARSPRRHAAIAIPSQAADEQPADLKRPFGHDDVVALTYQIVLENLHSQMNSALGITENKKGR